MIKGAQKRMIVVKTADSKLFEEAYFVMRGDMNVSEGDMVSEANKIIERCNVKRRERARRAPSALLVAIFSFIGGSIFSCLTVLAVMLCQ